MNEFEYTADMREISGFGGGYEDACRRMVKSGVLYLRSLPEGAAKPEFDRFSRPENEAAKGLEIAVMAEVPDCTGAMFGAAISHALYIHQNSWADYCMKMRRTPT